MKKKVYLLFSLLLFFVLNSIVLAANVDTETIGEIYALVPKYEEKISISNKYATSYKIPVSNASTTPTYSIKSGSNMISVDNSGVVRAKKTNYYCKKYDGYKNCWYGDSTTSEYDTVETTQKFGTAVVNVTVDNTTYEVTINVLNYAVNYSQDYMKKYLDDNVTDDMTDAEKMDIIAKFIASYPYSATSTSYVGFILGDGGDCIASSNTAVYMARYLGYKAHVRYAVKDIGAGSNHHNAVVLTDDGVYLIEAGFSTAISSTTGYRYYEVYLLDDGWSWNYSSHFYQYDGYDEIVNVPTIKVNGEERETSIKQFALYYGLHSESNIKTININKLINKVEGGSFSYVPTLQNINVDANNPYYVSVNGVLYTKDMKTLVAYPSGRQNETFTVPSTVTKIEDYAFATNKYLKAINLPSGLETIGNNAFYNCYELQNITIPNGVKSIGKYAFYYTNITDLIIPASVDTVGASFIRNYYTDGISNVIFYGTTTEVDNISTIKSFVKRVYGYETANVKTAATNAGIDYVVINSKKMISRNMISGLEKSITYSKNLKPNLVIKDNNYTLVEGTDYTLTVSDIKNSSTGLYMVVEVEGIGNYYGYVYHKIAVEKRPLNLKIKSYDVLMKDLDKGFAFTSDILEGDSVKLYYAKKLNSSYSESMYYFSEPGEYEIYYKINVTPSYGYAYESDWQKVKVNIYRLPETISISKTNLTLAVDSSETLSAVVLPTDARDKNLTWSSSNESVAIVDQNGKVTAKSAGSAKITAKTNNNINATCNVTVKANEPINNDDPGNNGNEENGLIPVYRMYNPINGEHLYTTDAYEVKVIYEKQGWGFEGIGWYTSNEGTPVYRLYNPKLGNHLYTSDTYEISVITKTQGWVLDFDGAPVMYSNGDIPIYRLFNPGLQGQHHLTTDFNEYNVIPLWGWQQEGISMNAVKSGVPVTTYYYKKSKKPINFNDIKANV